LAAALTGKIVPRHQIGQRLSELERPLVMTNGVFDVLHRGHVSYLARARDLGASLLVAINTDASARRLGKGPERPLNREADRAIMLAALQAVDMVTFFDEDTPVALIGELRPNILVKGGDYDMSKLPETALVHSWGGKALALPFVDGYSTTALVQKIRQT
jgi:rfaE bifunctional protein nucleotidyltransferase chain/domain